MKYLLTVLIIIALSCSKDSDDDKQQPTSEPTAKNVTCKTVYSSPSVPNIHWSVTVNTPDTNAVKKLYFKRVSPSYTAFEIDKPKSKTYTLIQPGYAGPTYNNQAFFYFEWEMSDGSRKQETPFQVWEQ